MATTTQRYASRDLRTGRVSHCGSRSGGDGWWHVSMAHRAGHGDPFPVGRDISRLNAGPNDAPRRYRKP